MSLSAYANKWSRRALPLAALALLAACAEPAPVSNQQLAMANTQADLTSVRSNMQEMRQRLEALESRMGPQGQGVSLEEVNARLTRLEATVARMATSLGVDTGSPMGSGPAAAPPAGQTPPPPAASPAPPQSSGDSGSDDGSAPQGYVPPATTYNYESAPRQGAPQTAPGEPPAAGIAPADQAESIYKMAEDAFNQRDMARASALLDQLVKSYPNSPLVPEALFWQAQATAQQGDYGKAALISQDLIQKFPNNPKVPSAMLTQSLAFRKLGKAQAAQTVLQEVIKRFPNTPEARSAQAQLRLAQ